MSVATLLCTTPDVDMLCFPFQLIHNKANINAINEHGNTPLHYACFWGYDQIAEVSAFSTVSKSVIKKKKKFFLHYSLKLIFF